MKVHEHDSQTSMTVSREKTALMLPTRGIEQVP